MNIGKIVQNAKCLVLGATVATLGLSAVAAEPEAVQLWEGGPYFATCNVGATKPEEYGYYFWWGDTVGYYYDHADDKWVSGKDGTTSILFQYGSPLIPFHTEEAKILANYELPMALVDYVDADGNLKPDHDAATAHLGAPWRMMTKAEVDQLIANCDVVWMDDWNNTGVKGSVVKGRGDYAANSVFFPAAGLGYDSNLEYDGLVGYYWSSTWDDEFTDNVWGLYLSLDDNSRTYPAYYYGYSVRAVRDTAPVTGPSVTVGEVTSGEPWSTITINYTLGGTDATLDYKVAFDVTASGQTASVTNAAAKLTDGAATKVIDTAALFGKQLADANAKVKVSLIAIKPKNLEGAQLGAGDAAEEEVVAFGESEFWLGGDEIVVAAGEGGFWLGPDEIVVASGEKEFALTAFRELPENPTAEDVLAAIEASGAKDKNRILALIGGAADPVAAYQAFNAWAQGVGTVAVANSDHAGDSFAFGVEELFENEPEVQISDVAVASGAPGAMAISVTVKDGDSPKRVASEKVAQMFEATTNVADWTEGRVETTVTDRTKALATPVEFTVKSGDGTSEKAFLRIRK